MNISTIKDRFPQKKQVKAISIIFFASLFLAFIALQVYLFGMALSA